MHRELEVREPIESGGEMVDGVVARRQRAVPARIGHVEAERLEQLLARLEAAHDALAVLDQRIAAVDVETELGVDEIAMILEQPVDAVVAAAALFAGGEREDQRAR